ncbi:hypothetical protein FM104_04805 [Microbacterium esteraromaticum]|uniref:Uncharacterized protein n=1 Tax=Microbacterium esteraromaticum TaxID=57043 RepID=A0A1R4IZH5_9MICO|nr:hypothetical protein [Microbacterium esteraromaticum]SJN25270.1 hypothetical protein FM104_04805 [Microbacterium esteraromaticum]
MSDEQAEERGPVSWEAHHFMRQELARLQAENADLRGDVDYWQRQTNHWYMKANYSPEQIAEFQRRLSEGEQLEPPETKESP